MDFKSILGVSVSLLFAPSLYVGLPPMSHVDDALRAVGAARMLIDILPQNFPDAGVSCSVGVTTGTVRILQSKRS